MVLLSPAVQHYNVRYSVLNLCMWRCWWLWVRRPHHSSLLALFRSVHIGADIPVKMHDTLWHGGEKATVAVASRHTAASEILKCSMFNFMDLTFCHLSICILQACMDKCTSGVEGCTHMQPLHGKTPPASFLSFCSQYWALIFLWDKTKGWLYSRLKSVL